MTCLFQASVFNEKIDSKSYIYRLENSRNIERKSPDEEIHLAIEREHRGRKE